MSLDVNCSDCSNKACMKGGEYPDECPVVTEKNTIDSAIDCVSNSEDDRNILASAEASSRQKNGVRNNRIETLIQFCHEMHYTTIGVAFCVSLTKEAQSLCDMLSSEQFRVVSVCCKIGGNTLSDMGVESSQIDKVACNPVAQAHMLNAHNTAINVLVGLCMGHDMLFAKHSNSPITTLVVKDHVLKHNTIKALQGLMPVPIN